MGPAICLNCGTLIPHQRDEHVAMAFRPGVAENPDYVVAVNGVEVHRCSGPTEPGRRVAQVPQTAK